MDPATTNTNPNGEFKVTVIQNASVSTSGAQADIKFDYTKMQLIQIDKGSPYEPGSLLWGAREQAVGTGTPTPTPVTADAALARANSETGLLEQVAVFFANSSIGSIPAGDAEALVLTFRANKGVSGTSQIELINPKMVKEGDDTGEAMSVTASTGEVSISGDEATATPSGTATVTGTETATPSVSSAASATPFKAVAGAATSPTKLPNAGVFASSDKRWLIMLTSSVTLLASMAALANTWLRRRKSE